MEIIIIYYFINITFFKGRFRIHHHHHVQLHTVISLPNHVNNISTML